MLKLISNVSRRGLVLGALALCLTTTAAWARVTYSQAPCYYPGVNPDGNLNVNLGRLGAININVNTNTGKVHAFGKNVVGNLSGKAQTFINAEVDVIAPIPVTFTSSRYSCSKKGFATVAASGMALPPV